ncbi:hypothetical protein SAMN04487820_101203 [Actinopolyspora mzabensis]|uniref:Uncharacterized protein n=1 Tax=Actinopolyspora mzabensis TaxID=995066 RepID=A0A1G8VMY8_ACTMZ|nr:hypothetical protein SAMN04487820_101203 [Actinopolyspora mzabensis]
MSNYSPLRAEFVSSAGFPAVGANSPGSHARTPNVFVAVLLHRQNVRSGTERGLLDQHAIVVNHFQGRQETVGVSRFLN